MKGINNANFLSFTITMNCLFLQNITCISRDFCCWNHFYHWKILNKGKYYLESKLCSEVYIAKKYALLSKCTKFFLYIITFLIILPNCSVSLENYLRSFAKINCIYRHSWITHGKFYDLPIIVLTHVIYILIFHLFSAVFFHSILSLTCGSFPLDLAWHSC